jgi:hypothetical protein
MLRSARDDRPARWVIVDGRKERPTGCGKIERAAAEAELSQYRHRLRDAGLSRLALHHRADIHADDFEQLSSLLHDHRKIGEAILRLERSLWGGEPPGKPPGKPPIARV